MRDEGQLFYGLIDLCCVVTYYALSLKPEGAAFEVAHGDQTAGFAGAL